MPFCPMIDTSPGFSGIVISSNQVFEIRNFDGAHHARFIVIDGPGRSNKDAILRLI